MEKLITEEQLADLFALDVDKLRELRRRERWPHVRLGRFEIRYTADQVSAIIVSHTVTAGRRRSPEDHGLTPRSASRL